MKKRKKKQFVLNNKKAIKIVNLFLQKICQGSVLSLYYEKVFIFDLFYLNYFLKIKYNYFKYIKYYF